MEKEDQKWEQPELEEHEEEETPLVVKKSRNGNGSKTTEVDVEVSSNGVSESNGHTIESEVAANGAQHEESFVGEEETMTEELDAVPGNGKEAINWEKRLDGILENKPEVMNGEKDLKELDGVFENKSEPVNGEKNLEELDGGFESKSEPVNGEKKLEELDGVFESKSEPVNGEKKSVELDGGFENGSEATNGEQKPESIVFYDKAEGIWKCQICTWTYGNGSVCVDHVQSHKGLFHKLMNVKTLNFEYQGVESASTYFGEKQIVNDPAQTKYNLSSGDFIFENTSATNNGHKEDLQEDSFPSYNSSKEIETAEIDQINDGDLEIKELDVERVIKKQTTHDLYCPNCKSCITKRVILRKRKRRPQIPEEELEKPKTKTDSKLVSGTGQSTSEIVPHTDEVTDNDTQQPTAEGDEPERGPDVFRCLSCFSIFIPTGNGFKLFRKIGDKSGKETIRDEQAPAVKKNWFTSIFGSNKLETAVEQGSNSQINVTNVPKSDVGSLSSSKSSDQSSQPSVSQKTRDFDRPVATPVNNNTLEGKDKILPSPRQKPPLTEKSIDVERDIVDVKAANTIDPTVEQFDADSSEQLKGSKSMSHVNGGSYQSATTLPKMTQVTNGESQQDELKLPISSNKGPQTLDSFEEGQISNQTIQSVDTDVPPAPVSTKASDEDGKLNITETVLENKNANITSSNGGQIYPTEASQHILPGEPPKVDNILSANGTSVAQDEDVIITIPAQPPVPAVTPPTQTPTVSEPGIQTNIPDRERREARNELQIEVIKSIVYGGLAESITSLSVVSSAAGGGAGTLNVLAIGMANLIGGFFIICHNLWDLKCERVVEHVSTQVATQVSDEETNPRDRYKELLGRRQNFFLHAVVAVISYLVFGLAPPLIYAFSFRNSNDKQLKLLVVAAASLLCIVVLAIGRAHVRCRPRPYFQSITTFVILGFMVSGASYAAGGLVERLLEKLGWFESGSVSNLHVPQMMMMGGSGSGSGSGRAAF